MSEDEYEMTSFKRRKVTDDHVSDADSEEPVSKPTQKRRFERKQIDMDDIDILKENEEHGENSYHVGSDNEELDSGMSEEDSYEKPPEVYHEYQGAENMNFENDNDFIEDDENNQLVYEKVGENRIQYYNAAVEYFGDEILYFIKGSSAAEELREEGIEESVPQEAPPTKEMEAMKEAEEVFRREEDLMTERDLEIAKKDIPERIQLLEPIYMLTDYQELQDCCSWIYQEARFHYKVTFDDGDEGLVKDSISNIIRLFAEEHLEPQYIMAMEIRYLKYLQDEDVWLICELYSQYIKLLEHGKSLKKSIDELRDLLKQFDRTDACDCLDRLLMSFSYDLIVPNEQSINLIQQYYTLLNNAIRSKLDTSGTVKNRGNRIESKFYRLFSMELLDLALRFNVELDRVPMNIQAYMQQAVPQDPAMTPEQLVEDFYEKNPSMVSDMLPSELLGEASALYGLCLSFDRHVIELARNEFYESAVISTNPTDRGVREIDTAHSLFGLHRLRNKPLGEMEEEDFLLLEQGENDGLITYSISVSEGISSLQQKLMQLLTVENTPYTPFQQQAVQNCCQLLQRETVSFLKERIRKRSYEGIARSCGKDLHKLISFKGYYNKHKQLATVLALALESNPSVSSTAVIVNENGVVVDQLILGKGGRINKTEMDGFLSNVEKIFTNNTNIDVIILNTALQNQTIELQKKINEKIDEICSSRGVSKPEVIIMNDAVAHLRCSCDDDVYYPASLDKYKLGIYCARYFQNPLREVASLFDRPDEPSESTLMQLELNTYQSLIPPTYLVKEYEKCICMEVAEACVCIQDAMTYLDGYGTLQFLPGLGYRKARDFVNTLVAKGALMCSREKMKEIMNMGDVVFKNCNAFIKFAVRKLVNIEELHDDKTYNVLDMVRVPHHLYPAMTTICEFITSRANSCVGQKAVIEVILHASSYERKQDGSYTLLTDDDLNELEDKNPSFIDIPMLAFCSELRESGGDMRDSITNLSPEELFYIIAGETKESFHKGTEVTATVIRVYDGKRILVRLDNNLMGTISGNEFSDKASDIEIASNIVGAGDSITCRVVHIDTVNFTVELTSRPSIVNDRNGSSAKRDPYYCPEPEEWETSILDDIEKRLVEEQKTRQLIKRHIFSNLYFCVNYEGAIDILKDKPQGSCLFRPSPEGLEQIVLTYKMLNDLYVSYDVYEHKKDPSDRSKLGAVLELCKEKYIDLEEIVDRFVGSVSQLVNDVTCYAKYIDKKDEEIDEIIEKMHQEQPKYLPYLLSVSRKQPGLLKISYYKRNRVNHEYAELRPRGILYDDRIFQHVESWVAYFKSNIRQILAKRIEEQKRANPTIPNPQYYPSNSASQPSAPPSGPMGRAPPAGPMGYPPMGPMGHPGPMGPMGQPGPMRPMYGQSSYRGGMDISEHY